MSYKVYCATSRISQHALDEIFRSAKSIKALSSGGDSIIRVNHLNDKDEYILKITDDGVYAGFLEDVK